MEITTTKEVAERPSKRKYRKGIYAEPLRDFMESDQGTLKYMLGNAKETSVCYTAITTFIKRHDLNAVAWRRNNTVYVIKG